jgi:acyl-CoA reductase-like NAD-dependent aldehyde dehydrogenase
MVANSKTFKTSADKDAFMGPISNKMQYDRVNATLDEIEHQELNIALMGRNSMSEPGYFIPPTIVDNPSDDSNIVREGCFGTFIVIDLP